MYYTYWTSTFDWYPLIGPMKYVEWLIDHQYYLKRWWLEKQTNIKLDHHPTSNTLSRIGVDGMPSSGHIL